MKKLMIIFGIAVAIATMFTSCSILEDESTAPPIPQELAMYVDEFKIQAKIRNIKIHTNKLSIVYGHTMPEKFGFTHIGVQEIKITLDSGYCANALQYYPERIYALVFHELGHGLLKRDHVNTKSLMNPEYLQTENWKNFVDELFSK